MIHTKEKRKIEWKEWLIALIIAVLLALFLRSFVFSTSIVDGDSMYPTLQDNQRVLFNRMIYIIKSPDRGDIVIIERPIKNYVKRVIGLPGEVIEMKSHQLYINNKKVSQSFVSKDAINHTGNFGPIKIPKDSYFVMGDNRAISKDSRNGLGFIDSGDIIGKSELIIYPFKEWSRTK